TLGHPLDVATGIEKRELLAIMAGNKHPFDDVGMERGPGTKDCPTEIPSAYDKRIVGCRCNEHVSSISYMWLHRGHPKRCECGYWFKLVYKAPV
ncbi:hypothetical protein PPYR_08055, partial [Photinus pyralis]